MVGASSGIGRAVAVQFAREGVRVMASARREDRLRQLQAEAGIDILPADVADAAAMQRLGAAALQRFGGLDILVYAAGTNSPDRWLPRMTVEVWNEVIQVNLNGAYYITHALLPAMRAAKRGHLIYISSISGLMPDISGAAYQASKRGLVALAHAIRVEEKKNGIRTCVVCPGLVKTEILEKRPFKTPEEELAAALEADDVAQAVLAIAKLPARASVPELQILPTLL
ncbi:MAG TPA: SDR family oxidoreductase [Bryobacteraceae bacterium]|nr:SDR family oxidoreductase [Bryobacteraceae bacterium]